MESPAVAEAAVPRGKAAAATQPPTRHSAFMRLTPEFASYLKTLPKEAQARWLGLLRWGRYAAVFTLAAPHSGAHPGILPGCVVTITICRVCFVLAMIIVGTAFAFLLRGLRQLLPLQVRSAFLVMMFNRQLLTSALVHSTGLTTNPQVALAVWLVVLTTYVWYGIVRPEIVYRGAAPCADTSPS